MRIDKKIPLVFGVPGRSFFETIKAKQVFIAELRPGLEGIKAVANEALKKGIQPVIICDNMLAYCMSQGLVKDVHIFYHALNKKFSLCRTGSFIAAFCAKAHKIPVYLYRSAEGCRKPSSLLKIDGGKVTSGGFKTYVPVFEEVPLGLIKREHIHG